tara:strand:+ start:666 stop:803 length:138 start_codon:yes stop_codon:yes gene_type:complete
MDRTGTNFIPNFLKKYNNGIIDSIEKWVSIAKANNHSENLLFLSK